MAKESMNRLRTFSMPIPSTVWCVLLTIVSFIILLITPEKNKCYGLVQACTTGVSASAVVTFFAERANKKKQKHYIAVRLADFHTIIDRCCPLNVSDEGRKQVVEDDGGFWAAVYDELEKARAGNRTSRDNQDEFDKWKEKYREICILSMVILTREFDELKTAFEDVDMSCLTETELKWVSSVRGYFRKLIDCVADDIPVKESDHMNRMDTRLHAMQRYLSIRQEVSQRDLVRALIEKNLKDILLNHPNLLSDAAAVKALDLGCIIMAYVGSLDDEFIRSGYIKSERKPDPSYGSYEYYSEYYNYIDTAV